MPRHASRRNPAYIDRRFWRCRQFECQRNPMPSADVMHRQRKVADVAGHPQGLQVRHGAATGHVRPSELFLRNATRLRRWGIAEHAQHICAHLKLPPQCYWRRLRCDVVRIVEHAGEIAEHTGDGLVRQHVRVVARAVEGKVRAQASQYLIHLLCQPVVEIERFATHALSHQNFVGRKIVAPPRSASRGALISTIERR